MEHQWVHAYRNRKTHIANRKREVDGDDGEKISKYKIAETEREKGNNRVSVKKQSKDNIFALASPPPKNPNTPTW